MIKNGKKGLTAGQQMKRVGLVDCLVSVPGRDGDDNGMSSVVPSGAPRTNIRIDRQNVHKLSFSFISPLCPKHDGGRHFRLWGSRLVFFLPRVMYSDSRSGRENCPQLDLDLLVTSERG